MASPSTVANSVAVTARTSARISRSIEPSAANALENDAGVVVGGMQREGDGKAGMHADAGDGNLVAQRCLLSALHLPVSAGPQASRASHPQLLPGHILAFRSATACRSGRHPPETEKSLSPLKLRPYVRPAPTHVFLPTVTLFCRNFPGYPALAPDLAAMAGWQAASASKIPALNPAVLKMRYNSIS